ncbi:MAG: AraC family transcriptional regulator [Lachnospiraceae bacterium]|nr:AraC family transcriptional regulator [Lachnospiraceae bacterium]
MDVFAKRGYLKEDFRIFYLKSDDMEEMDAHYHDFDKIVFFLNGNASYRVEGRTYALEPFDLVLVGHGEVHRPILHETAGYERMIFYLEPDFLSRAGSLLPETTARETNQAPSVSLRDCFTRAKNASSHVLRIPSIRQNRLFRIVSDLKFELARLDRYGARLASRLLLLEFLLEVNRQALSDGALYPDAGEEDAFIIKLLSYLHAHLAEELTINRIAEAFYISPSYLMHRFKRETGSTVGQYLSRKRLMSAKDQIRAGTSATEAAFACGFQSYSAFFRAYKKTFGVSPAQSLRPKKDP